MNKIKFLQLTALSILLAVAFSSCKTSMDKHVRDLQLGMTKMEIVNKFGKKYEIVKLEKTEKGDEEVIRYPVYSKGGGKNKVVEKYYVFSLLNNELVKYSNENARSSRFDSLDYYDEDEY